jgi:hypothetical protein
VFDAWKEEVLRVFEKHTDSLQDTESHDGHFLPRYAQLCPETDTISYISQTGLFLGYNFETRDTTSTVKLQKIEV